MRIMDKDDDGRWDTPAGRFPVCTGSFLVSRWQQDINPQERRRMKQV